MKSTKTKKSRNAISRANKSNNSYGTGSFKINLRSQDIMPPSIQRSLNYVDGSYVRNNPGNNFLVYSMRINDLFDPDPLILSGSVSGFKELMQFYSYYRVKSVHISHQIFNNENFAIIYGYVFSQSNLSGVIANRDDAINALENDFSTRARILSAKGGLDHEDISTSLNLPQLLGNSQQYLADYNYIGQGVASPTVPLWVNFIVASPTGTALTNGYTNATTLTFHAEFFGRTNLRA